MCKIENYILNNEKDFAKIALKDIKNLRNDLDEIIDELTFMIGDSAINQQNLHDELIGKQRQMLRQVNTNERNTPEMSSLKLTPISIPTFTGSFKVWPTFSGLFKTMVISNHTFNDIKKLQYLKTIVTGEAEKSIANIEITGENFEEAF